MSLLIFRLKHAANDFCRLRRTIQNICLLFFAINDNCILHQSDPRWLQDQVMWPMAQKRATLVYTIRWETVTIFHHRTFLTNAIRNGEAEPMTFIQQTFLPIQFYCKSLPLSSLVDQRKLNCSCGYRLIVLTMWYCVHCLYSTVMSQ